MSFDLIAFDLSAAPVDRYQFLGWIRDQCSGALLADDCSTGPSLLAWQRDMAAGFAPVEITIGRLTAPSGNRAEYRFGRQVVHAAFDWDQSGPALYRARRAAAAAGVGLFDASGSERAVWAFGRRGRFEIVHSDALEAATA